MMSPATDLLLTTKVHRPGFAPASVERSGLLTQLDQGLAHRLILVSAPPGFGKTTLVSQWLTRIENRELRIEKAEQGADHSSFSILHSLFKTAWFSLDLGDNRLAQFLRYLVAAVRSAVPDACPTTRGLLAAPTLPEVDYLADVLAGELATLPVPLVLVLDDYHLITAPEVHALVDHLLRYPPPPLRLVILTRTDPPLHLARLRLQQAITELRAGDLRFDLAETSSLLTRRLSRPLDAELVQALHARTEGWVSGLQLASIALQREEPRQFLAHFPGGNRLLSAYLLEEVFAHLPLDLGEFLLRTALLERFCAPLAEALLDADRSAGGGQAQIDALQAGNLFLVPLDDAGIWYRYHDLFRDFLRAQLQRRSDTTLITQLHHRAGAWLAAAGQIDEALRHLLAAGEVDVAANLLEQQLHPTLDQQAPHSFLTGWLTRFPIASLESHPGLLLAQAWQLAISWDFAALASLLPRFAAVLKHEGEQPEERQALRQAVLDLLLGYMAYWQGNLPLARATLERAYAQMPTTHAYAQAMIILHLALTMAHIGQPQAARELVRNALAAAEVQQRPTQVILQGALAIITLTAADLSATAWRAERVLAVADTPWARAAWDQVGFVGTWRVWMHYLLGVVAYERNDLTAAQDHWEQITALRYWANPRTYHEALMGLALVAHAQGEEVVAQDKAQIARAFAMESRSSVSLAISFALEVRLALAGGRRAEALRQAEELPTGEPVGTAIWLELPPLARLRALLADGAPAALTAALRLAETCLAHAEGACNIRQSITILALQSLVLQAARRPEEAARALGRALTLGDPGGFIRTFLDLGAPMAELLRSYAASHPQSAYARKLLAAFAGARGQTVANPPVDQLSTGAGPVYLTPREREILALLDQRLTVEEIAARLVISANTVKRHTANIYAKLDVANRREASARARALGLLPSG